MLDISNMDSLSFQVDIASTNVSTFSITDGHRSTATITVVSTINVSGSYLIVNDQRAKGGTSFPVVNVTSGIATNIALWISSNPTLAQQMTASASSNVVTLTSLAPNHNDYTLSASTIALTCSGFSNGAPSDIVGSTITYLNHGLRTGFGLNYTKAGGTQNILTNNATYYVIKVDDNHIKLASSTALALVGSSVTFNPTSSLATNTFLFTPLVFSSGTAGYKFQNSNDNQNWIDVSGGTASFSGTASTLYTFDTKYNYLRMNVTAPTQGGLNIRAVGCGKKQP